MVGYGWLLRRYLAPQRRVAVLMGLLLLTGTALQVVAPRVLGWFINSAVAGDALSSLYRAALLFVGVSLAAQLMRVLASYSSERVAWTATNALRLDLTAHVLSLDMGFHKRRTPGELIERVDGDVAALSGFLSRFAVELVGSGLLLIGVLASLCAESMILGLAFSAFAVGATLLLGWVRRFAGAAIRDTRERSAGFYGYLGEVLAATEDIRSAGAAPYAFERLFRYLRGWLPIAVRAEVWSNFIWTAAICLFALGDALAYGLTAMLHVTRGMPVGTVYMVLAYAALLAQPLETIRTQLQDLQRADASIQRIGQLLETTSRVVDGTDALPEGPLALTFDGVSFTYEDSADEASVRALDGVSFVLPAGRRLGVLGRTGSGKTTLARLLLRMYDPQEGSISVGGTGLARASLAFLRARVGLVTQEVQLFSASLRDNITFFDQSVPDRRLVEILEMLGLGDWYAALPEGLDTQVSASSFSAGEAQLLAFARIFLQNPGLVVLDEASSRLDPASEELLGHAIERLLVGRTAVIIAHRLATVEAVDDILILEDGRVAEHGSRCELAADTASRFSALRRIGLTEVLT